MYSRSPGMIRVGRTSFLLETGFCFLFSITGILLGPYLVITPPIRDYGVSNDDVSEGSASTPLTM